MNKSLIFVVFICLVVIVVVQVSVMQFGIINLGYGMIGGLIGGLNQDVYYRCYQVYNDVQQFRVFRKIVSDFSFFLIFSFGKLIFSIYIV